jgi:hypothetical protein
MDYGLNIEVVIRRDLKWRDSKHRAIDEDDASFLTLEASVRKLLHFCYSFSWSKKSYVLTKEWLSFVKEKKLSHGDIVSFYQRIGNAIDINQRFICSRRKIMAPLCHITCHLQPSLHLAHSTTTRYLRLLVLVATREPVWLRSICPMDLWAQCLQTCQLHTPPPQ